MNHATPWILVVAVASLALSGCSGGSETPIAPGGTQAPRDGAVGALSGQATDDEQRPVVEALVKIEGLERQTLTTAEGRFVFAQVPVGNYTVSITRGGFEPRTSNVSVAEGRTSVLTVIMIPLPGTVAFYVTFPYGGFQDCMVYTSVYLMPCSYPYTAAHGTAKQHGVNLSQYNVPPDVMENKYRYNFTVEENHTGIVSELSWRANTDASKYYVLQLSCAWYDSAWDDCVVPGESAPENQNTYARARGVSPLRIEWKHEFPKWLPWVMSRAYLSGPADRPAGVAVDQKIEMWNTVFYGAPVPKDWSILTLPTG